MRCLYTARHTTPGCKPLDKVAPVIADGIGRLEVRAFCVCAWNRCCMPMSPIRHCQTPCGSALSVSGRGAGGCGVGLGDERQGVATCAHRPPLYHPLFTFYAPCRPSFSSLLYTSTLPPGLACPGRLFNMSSIRVAYLGPGGRQTINNPSHLPLFGPGGEPITNPLQNPPHPQSW